MTLRGTRLFLQRALIFPGAAVLSELNDEESKGGEESDMHHPAFVQQEFENEPNNKYETSRKPEHSMIPLSKLVCAIVRVGVREVESQREKLIARRPVRDESLAITSALAPRGMATTERDAPSFAWFAIGVAALASFQMVAPSRPDSAVMKS